MFLATDRRDHQDAGDHYTRKMAGPHAEALLKAVEYVDS